DTVDSLRIMLTSFATGQGGDCEEYRRVRAMLLRQPSLRDMVPQFVRTCRSLDDFWSFIKAEFQTYQERRAYLREQFHELLAALEDSATVPADAGTTAVLSKVDSVHVQEVW